MVANTAWNIWHFRMALIGRLLEGGHEVSAVAPVDEYAEQIKSVPGLTFYVLNKLRRSGINPVHDVQLYFELKKLYQSIQPDIIIHFTHKLNIFGGWAAKHLGLRSYGVVTGLGYGFINHGLLRFIMSNLYRLSAHAHHDLIFENKEDLQLFRTQKIIPAHFGTAVNGCGVNCVYYAPLPNSQPADQIIFLFLGRLLVDKGLLEFLHAAEGIKTNFPHVKFWVAGAVDKFNPAGIDPAILNAYSEKGVIDYLGFVEDVRPLLAACTCLVLPSYREAMARSITEAMAMEKPVITTDTAGCRELIEDERGGFVMPVKDVPGLAAAMTKMIQLTHQDRMRMGQVNRDKVNQLYADPIVVGQYLALLELVR